MTDEGVLNVDWNPVWDVRTSPAAAGVPGGMFRLSRAGTIVGLDLPPASKNVELKPYAITRITTDKSPTPTVLNDSAMGCKTGTTTISSCDVGLDAKCGVTANLTVDVTANTDFAQVEVDEQQVNLTRFSIVYPEKRDFFLEGRGLFDFARSGASSSTAAPTMFCSRRIRLNGTRIIPIDIGSRLTGKVGRFGLGAMNIQTRDDAVSNTPRTSFSVVRVKRDILRRSTIGGIPMHRSKSALVPGASNLTYGADGAFSFFQNLNVGGYVARSDTETLKHDNES